MDVSASLGSINSLPAYQPPPPASAKAPVSTASSASSFNAELTSAPSPTPRAVDAAVARLPASVRYAPSSPPREASIAAPLDVTV